METCDCNWTEDESGGIRPCGGCEDNCRLYRDDVVHHDDKHWHTSCLANWAVLKLSALLKYVDHHEGCPHWHSIGDLPPCNCGLAEVLK